MAANVQLDEGNSGKYSETEEVTTNIHRQVMKLGGVSACRLLKTKTVAEQVTCTAANTDYPMASAMASGTKYLVVYCSSACIVSMGEATSSTVGVYVGAGTPTTFPVTVTGTTADDKAHVQSATAGAVVRFTSMSD